MDAAGEGDPVKPSTYAAIVAELARARAKFPGNRHQLAALSEEVATDFSIQQRPLPAMTVTRAILDEPAKGGAK